MPVRDHSLLSPPGYEPQVLQLVAPQLAQELPVPATEVDSPDSPLVNEAQVDIIRAAVL